MRNHGQGSIITRPKTDKLYIRWRVDGKQYQEATGSASREYAEKLLATKIADSVRGVTLVDGVRRLTYEDIRAEYLRFRPAQADYPGLKHLDAFFKGRKVTAITRTLVAAFADARRKAGIHDHTIRRNLTCLRAMLNRAHKVGMLGSRDVPTFDIPAESNEGSGQYVTPEQFAAIRGFLPDRLRPLFTFLYSTACRIGAAKKIAWEMVNADATEINLPGSITKTRKPLKIVLVGSALEPVSKLLRKSFRDPEQPVFDSRDYKREWAKAVAKAALGTYDKQTRHRTGPRIHDLRVGGAVNMIDSGIPESTVLQIGGWRSASMLRRYNVLDRDRIAKAMRQVAEYTRARERAKVKP